MNVTREVILDLLPVYLAGEASAATRALVEEYMKADEEIARLIRDHQSERFARVAPSSLPPDLELRALRKTRRLIVWQKWLFGFAIAFTAFAFAARFRSEEGRLTDFNFLLFEYPTLFGTLLVVAAIFWIGYFSMRRRLRAAGF
jgi:hypothetical protein